ncbi:MAG TPA: GNAT family N-acetyltransferase [Ktedonobacterales bacterium]|jgi:ribosomal protein S18 acetylase RimI-like enzyme
MYPYLTPGYIVRSPTMEDIPAILALLRVFDTAEMGEADPLTPDTIIGDWEELDPTQDAWMVLASDGLLCGYATLMDYGAGRFYGDGYVHPDHNRRGIGKTLVEEMERRAAAIIAAEPDGTRRVLVNNVVAESAAARDLLETRGYELTRVYFRMRIDLEGTRPAPAWPEGISVRTCDGSLEDIQRAYETVEEGFRDSWAHIPRSFEEWQRHMVRESFDASLWFLAQEGDKVAGAALCRRRDDGSGWIEQLAVLRPWRKRGLGLALLRHAFTVFDQREIRRVGLGVDGQSLTGAQRLYERAGMRVTARIACYEKELRPGRDLMDEL